jgi:hypothetical protein
MTRSIPVGCDRAAGPPPSCDEHVPDAALVGLQGKLDVMIVQQWAQTLAGSYDWGIWPLARYTFSDAFLRHLDGDTDLDDVAWVCAMVACGLAQEFVELAVEPRLQASSGERLVREDGAHQCRCSIRSGRGKGSQLDFWGLPSGVIEFDAFTAIKLVLVGASSAGQGPATGA